MSVTLINGDGNPRVLASQDADWYGALTGQKTCIVPINDNLTATITDSNTVEIGSGVCITKEGRRVQIDEGDIEEIIIPTGTQGVDTYYIIGFHLYINESGQQVAETFVETMASATDTITETTFKEGSSSIYVSLYRVKRSGLLMDSVTKIIPTLKTIVDINDTLGSSDISAIGDGTVTGGLSQLNSDLNDVKHRALFSKKYTTTTLTFSQCFLDFYTSFVNSGIFESLSLHDKWNLKLNLNGALYNLVVTPSGTSFAFIRITSNNSNTLIQAPTLSNTPSFYFTTITTSGVTIADRGSFAIGSEMTYVLYI